MTWFLTAVRHEVNNLETSVVVQELEFAINRALYGLLWSLCNQYIIRSLSWRSLTHTENFRAKWLQCSKLFYFTEMFCFAHLPMSAPCSNREKESFVKLLCNGMWGKESIIDVQCRQDNPNPRVHRSIVLLNSSITPSSGNLFPCLKYSILSYQSGVTLLVSLQVFSVLSASRLHCFVLSAGFLSFAYECHGLNMLLYIFKDSVLQI